MFMLNEFSQVAREEVVIFVLSRLVGLSSKTKSLKY